MPTTRSWPIRRLRISSASTWFLCSPGHLLVERRWGQPCLAYSVCIQPGADARADLSCVQEGLLSLEPSLLPVQSCALRRQLVPALSVPSSLSAGELVHTTLFRYARPLRDPPRLMRRLTGGLHVNIDVREVLVIRERIFPSLDYEVLRRISLEPGAPSRIRHFDE